MLTFKSLNKHDLTSLMEAKKLVIAILFVCSLGYGQLVASPSIVALDGSGSFRTISDAIQAAPNNSKERHIVKVKKGVYNEHLIVGKEKTNIVLIGEGMDSTIITGKRSNANGFRLDDTATVGEPPVNFTNLQVKYSTDPLVSLVTGILGDGFIAQGITIQNAAGPEGIQAVALLTNANNLTFFQSRITGYQDTLYTRSGRVFFRDCEISGTIDFIFGDSTSMFQNCIIQARRPLPNQYVTITAQGKLNNLTRTAFVFQNCTVNTDELNQSNTQVPCYLGRPWKDFSRTIFMQSYIDDQVHPAGWITWEGNAPVHPYFAEYFNRGPGSNTSRRVNWSTIISSPTEASQFTLRYFLDGGDWITPNVPRNLDL